MSCMKILGYLVLLISLQAEALQVDCVASNGVIAGPQAECNLTESMVPAITSEDEKQVEAFPSMQASGLPFNSSRSTNPLEESAPLIVFFSIVIAIFLVRSKSLNTK